MSKDLNEVANATHVAEIVHHGEKLILPEGLSINKAIDLLYRRAEYLEAKVNITERFDVFPFDGAYALSQVIIERYGWAEGKPIKQMFGERKPQVFKIPCSPTEKVDVPWGLFELPNIDGQLHTDVDRGATGRAVFVLSAEVKRKDEPTIRALFDELRNYLAENSLYRGKAIKIRFRDDDGDIIPLPEPEFMDVSTATPDSLLLNKDLMHSVNANLFTPITRVQDCLQNGIKVKRGVLLGGPYGTGKTLAATVAANLAQANGITYIYTPRADELKDAIAFAKQYQSPACVVFCEDIDRQVTGERSVAIDDILNILDGIDTKSENIITVLTTNHLDNVNQAMLRPGRLDAIMNIEAPDAETAVRLVRYYGGEAINPEEDLTEVGVALSGQIPAVIEETVKRAKLFQLAIIDKGAAVTDISAEALRQAAVTMSTQIDLLAEPEEQVTPDLDKAMREVIAKSINGTEKRPLVS
jgi:transitional endoplasmic reticulum ATPase